MDNVVARIEAHAEAWPDKAAFEFEGVTTSYGELAALVQSFSTAARWQGVVLVFLPQNPEAIASYFGIMRAGAVPSFMPLPSAKQRPDLYWSAHKTLVERIKPSAILTTTSHAGEVRRVGLDVPVLAIDDLRDNSDFRGVGAQYTNSEASALLQHSSGTTGLKKGVELSHRAICAQVDAYAAALKASSDDVVVSWLPVYHDMGLVACTLTPLMLGQTIVLLDPFRWVANPRLLFQAITEHRGTHCWLPNFAFEHMMRTTRAQGYDLSSMRAFVSCSEPVKAATLDRFAERYGPIGVRREMLQASYALAETVFAVTQTEPGQPAKQLCVDASILREKGKVVERDDGECLVSSGKLLQGAEIAIEPETEGADAGEIRIRGDFLFSGYYARPDLTEQKIRAGWYHSGDIGFVRDGEVYVLGRMDDLIIVHGKNIYAHEIEAIAANAGLKPGRNVAIGVFNNATGSEDAILLAEETGEADQAELRSAVKSAVAQALSVDIHDLVFVPPGWLTKTTSGKISRNENKRRYVAGELA